MAKENQKRNENDNKEVAGSFYKPSFYKGDNQLQKGIAITHEQVSDTLTEGTIDGEIDQFDENDSQ